MAGFRMHVSTSSVLGCCYAGVLHFGYHVPPETAVVAGAMCGFSGMLPDLDSDYGVPLRETMAFTAATLPMMLVPRFQSFQLSHDAMALAAVGMYLFVRFGITKIIRKYTVHRGMFHSFPMMLIFTGLAFLITGASPIDVRCIKAGGVMGGFLSHLVLDEIYAVEWKGGRWRLKKSFGTAMKFWGDDAWSNFSIYAKLAIVVMLIVGEPSVMQQIEARNPQIAGQINQFRSQVGALNPNAAQQPGGGNVVQSAVGFVKGAINNRLDPNSQQNSAAWPQQFATAPQQGAQQQPMNAPPSGNNSTPWPWQQSPQPAYDTAQRPGNAWPQ